jgi:hypothetical protein
MSAQIVLLERQLPREMMHQDPTRHARQPCATPTREWSSMSVQIVLLEGQIMQGMTHPATTHNVTQYCAQPTNV